MVNIDTSSYSCEELVAYLEIHGTDREKQLTESVSIISNKNISLEDEIEDLSRYVSELEDESDNKDGEIDDLEVVIVGLKEEIKELTE